MAHILRWIYQCSSCGNVHQPQANVEIQAGLKVRSVISLQVARWRLREWCGAHSRRGPQKIEQCANLRRRLILTLSERTYGMEC